MRAWPPPTHPFNGSTTSVAKGMAEVPAMAASYGILHRCPLKRKAAVIGILRPLTLGLSHALLALQEEDGGKGWKVVERRGRP
jgi:hypothetical protein